ncbi:MAG: alpha-amylase family glycosyl hydrolase [Anaerolineae bacterium]
MKRSMCLFVLVFVLTACGTATLGPTEVPASPTPLREPTDTLVPVSPTPVPEPTGTSPPRSPTPVPREPAWWDEPVFYEIFVRSFYDSDGDGIGDLPGVIEKLDYLDELGVTGLWLMPIFVSPSYHGYDVVDYRVVNPDYGSNDDFVRLMDEAHQRGLHVILDLVLNHTSDQHPWFVESASGPDAERRDWYIWSETDPGYLGPWGEPVWHNRNGAYYYGVFWSGMPDLNLENQAVTAELYDVARYWLEEMGADGFRLDAARHYIEDGKEQAHTRATHAWLQDFRAFGMEVSPEMLTVGEIWDVSDAVASYVGSDVDLAFEFSLAKAILLSVNEGGTTALASAMTEVQRLYPEGGYATFLTNHDQNRVMDELGRDPDLAKLAATALLTLPGVPFVYYGEEIGMTGSKPDELIRTPMQWSSGPNAGFTTGHPWEPVNWGYEDLNVKVQSEDPDSLFNRYRLLIALRTAHPALRSLAFQPLESAERSLYAYLRHVEGDAILVVLNFGDSVATEVNLGIGESSLPAGGYAAVDLLSGEQVAPLTVDPDGGVRGYEPLTELPARRALILHLEAGEP